MMESPMTNKYHSSKLQDLAAITEDHTVLRFPDVDVIDDTEHEALLDLEEIVSRQQDLLACWLVFGFKIKRRLYDVPFDLALELDELMRASASDGQ